MMQALCGSAQLQSSGSQNEAGSVACRILARLAAAVQMYQRVSGHVDHNLVVITAAFKTRGVSAGVLSSPCEWGSMPHFSAKDTALTAADGCQ